ncbi:dirigent protein [Mariniblastus sp.]|nr:dirigent protein [Mariniblastus sp.]MDC0284759.1 dirigent protein [Mariniblastus sp.]
MKNLILLLPLILLCTSCSPEQVALKEKKGNPSTTNELAAQTLKVHQELPDLTHIDLDKEGSSHGDLLAFDATVTSDNGMTGKLSGFIMTVDIPQKDHEVFQDRIVQMVFDFGEANTIVVGGRSVYPHLDNSEMKKNEPQYRAVIGGTGTFMGARGQVITTRNDDGTYEHMIELMD